VKGHLSILYSRRISKKISSNSDINKLKKDIKKMAKIKEERKRKHYLKNRK